MEHHAAARGALHRDPVPALGGAEAVPTCADGARAGVWPGGRATGQCGGRGGGGRHNAVGCAQDAYDACAGETAHAHHAAADIGAERAEGVFRRHRSESGLDQRGRRDIPGELPVGE